MCGFWFCLSYPPWLMLVIQKCQDPVMLPLGQEVRKWLPSDCIVGALLLLCWNIYDPWCHYSHNQEWNFLGVGVGRVLNFHSQEQLVSENRCWDFTAEQPQEYVLKKPLFEAYLMYDLQHKKMAFRSMHFWNWDRMVLLTHKYQWCTGGFPVNQSWGDSKYSGRRPALGFESLRGQWASLETAHWHDPSSVVPKPVYASELSAHFFNPLISMFMTPTPKLQFRMPQHY